MQDIVQIRLPLPHIRSVNTWLLRGDPLTLVDAGPCEDQAMAALEAGLRRAGVRVEDLELVLITHHHLDHSGLAAALAARSGATIATTAATAAYGERYQERSEADRRFSRALMRHHGVPPAVIDDNENFWVYIRSTSAPWHTDRVLADGERIRAGGRVLRVAARPGHSTTDALFVDHRDRLAFVGDHLLAAVSSNTEIYPAVEPDGTRPRARAAYLASLSRTAAMPLARLLSGHGEVITAHRELVRRRFEEHQRRCERILAVLDAGPASPYEIATRLWSEHTVATQPLLVIWEVLGHLDLLLDAGVIDEHLCDPPADAARSNFVLARPRGARRRTAGVRGFRFRKPRNHDRAGGGRHGRASRNAQPASS
jgi:glyoxylase-like metal-dependent hydrolase (beta-lactamase superfamily II)